MGTHPIFESDFDCLTDMPRKKKTKNIVAEIDNKNWTCLSNDEGVCLVCCSVLNEPIQLPCRCRTRMKCTMCRACFARMVSDNGSECRAACPVCGQRLLSWMRGVSRDHSEYRSVVNHALWAAIKEQFRPYNQDGKVAAYSLEAKRNLASSGDIHSEYKQQQEQVRKRFLDAKKEEEEEHLRLLTSDPQLQEAVEEQVKAMEEIERAKQRAKMEEQDAEMARKLMEEEKKQDEVKIIEPSKKRPGSSSIQKPPAKTSRYSSVVDIRSFNCSSSSSSSTPSSPDLFNNAYSYDSERTPSPDELFHL